MHFKMQSRWLKYERCNPPSHLDCPIEAARDDSLHVTGAAVKGEAGHGVVVATQHRATVAGIQLPHPDSLVPAPAKMITH